MSLTVLTFFFLWRPVVLTFYTGSLQQRCHLWSHYIPLWKWKTPLISGFDIINNGYWSNVTETRDNSCLILITLGKATFHYIIQMPTTSVFRHYYPVIHFLSRGNSNIGHQDQAKQTKILFMLPEFVVTLVVNLQMQDIVAIWVIASGW